MEFRSRDSDLTSSIFFEEAWKIYHLSPAHLWPSIAIQISTYHLELLVLSRLLHVFHFFETKFPVQAGNPRPAACSTDHGRYFTGRQSCWAESRTMFRMPLMALLWYFRMFPSSLAHTHITGKHWKFISFHKAINVLLMNLLCWGSGKFCWHHSMPNTFFSFRANLRKRGNLVMRLVRGCSMQIWQQRLTATITSKANRVVILASKKLQTLLTILNKESRKHEHHLQSIAHTKTCSCKLVRQVSYCPQQLKEISWLLEHSFCCVSYSLSKPKPSSSTAVRSVTMRYTAAEVQSTRRG